MSSDWDSVTIIGQKARVGGGGPRENVAKTSSQLNAARRAGLVVGTEKNTELPTPSQIQKDKD